MTFFLSRDPLSPAYDERSVSLRTEQAFVEHHLFVLLPTWLEAVKQGEWERLQGALRGDDDDEVSDGVFLISGNVSWLKQVVCSSRNDSKNLLLLRPARSLPPLLQPSEDLILSGRVSSKNFKPLSRCAEKGPLVGQVPKESAPTDVWKGTVIFLSAI